MSKEMKLALATGIFLVVSLSVLAELVVGFDWSTFVPDLLGAGLTGAIVGVALWQVERHRIAADERSRHMHDWSVLRRQVARALRKPSIYAGNSFVPVAYGIPQIQQAVERFPIALWATTMDELALDRLLKYLDAADDLIDAAEKLDASLNSAEDKVKSSDANSLVSSHVRRAIRGLVDTSRSYNTGAFDDSDFEKLDQLVRDPGLVRCAQAYRTEILAFESSRIDLLDSLGLLEGDVASNTAER